MGTGIVSIVRPWLLGGLIALAALAGCSAASVRFSSTRYVANVPIDRLLVRLDVTAWNLPAALYGRLETTLTEALKACHVTPRILRGDQRQPDDATRFRDDVNAFQPAAILTIKADGRHFDGTQSFVAKAFLDPQAASSMPHTLENDAARLLLALIGAAAYRRPKEILSSNITLFDSASAMPIWHARSEFHFVASGDMADLFERFAVLSAGTVSRLRDDGVLKHCPDRLDDVLCRADRRVALQAALQIKDDRERAAALLDAPHCRSSAGR